MIFLFLLAICLVQSRADWELIWSEEFNDNSIDTNKWLIENEEIACNGNYIHQLNCKTNNSRNLQLFDGVLAITAIPEKHLDKEYTSALIKSKQDFTFGRFVFRAALPRGKMLRPAIWMSPSKWSGQWPKDGQIDVMTNIQTKTLGNGIHFLSQKIEYEGTEYRTDSNLNHFHTYVLEWNESTIVWKFDEIPHQVINISQRLSNYYNPFESPFKLELTLGVGGQFFHNQVLTSEDIYHWHCSLFLLDYIRVYRWTKSLINITNETEDRESSSDICAAIMATIRPVRPINIPFIPIVSVLCLLLLLTLIPLVVYVFIRQKNVNSRQIVEQNVYDDHFNEEVYYETVKEDEEEYADPYQTTNKSNYYSYSKPEAVTKPEDNPNYLQFTNDYITKPL